MAGTITSKPRFCLLSEDIDLNHFYSVTYNIKQRKTNCQKHFVRLFQINPEIYCLSNMSENEDHIYRSHTAQTFW
ncbi:hypothetical protein AQUCO_00800113v1 [Aquilegia coerulea]|uniref:Uncharacterized protein n=1 Tax=Aquilegia coerulea TaxID=218851 RepID=A0A2G5EHC3_AQUCA|nr:hypothetical protein AQUCO_00800113v1 [Aquilegia coerulea]